MDAACGLAFTTIVDLIADGYGQIDVACPECGPSARSPVNQRRKTLRIWREDADFATYHCVRCGMKGWASDSRSAESSLRRPDLATFRAEIDRQQAEETEERLQIALSLWRRRLPIDGSPAETYLREARGYTGPLPSTLGFLPVSVEHPPAMIAAFGIPLESLPGELTIEDSAVRGVHITRLRSDGRGKAGTDRDKFMIGRSTGAPIVLAPLTDALGLAITEGIEDALSIHEATGLGVWAAGSATRMSALASSIADYVECVTIVADSDEIGLSNAQKLAEALSSHDCDVRVIVPTQTDRIAA
jgi:Zn ribbon nucleic-acid-binding protein